MILDAKDRVGYIIYFHDVECEHQHQGYIILYDV